MIKILKNMKWKFNIFNSAKGMNQYLKTSYSVMGRASISQEAGREVGGWGVGKWVEGGRARGIGPRKLGEPFWAGTGETRLGKLQSHRFKS